MLFINEKVAEMCRKLKTNCLHDRNMLKKFYCILSEGTNIFWRECISMCKLLSIYFLKHPFAEELHVTSTHTPKSLLEIWKALKHEKKKKNVCINNESKEGEEDKSINLIIFLKTRDFKLQWWKFSRLVIRVRRTINTASFFCGASTLPSKKICE